MKKRNAISFSVWLIPEEPIKSIVQKKINLLSINYGSPKFVPHVTLLSGFLGEKRDLVEKTSVLSERLSEFQIEFEKISYKNEFFCSLFLKVTKNNNIEKAHQYASKIIDYKECNFFPHMSLIYGDFSVSQKRTMISEFDFSQKGFRVKNLYLASNDEINLKWDIICKFPLNN